VGGLGVDLYRVVGVRGVDGDLEKRCVIILNNKAHFQAQKCMWAVCRKKSDYLFKKSNNNLLPVKKSQIETKLKLSRRTCMCAPNNFTPNTYNDFSHHWVIFDAEGLSGRSIHLGESVNSMFSFSSTKRHSSEKLSITFFPIF
jgi:hypothetical protein